MFNIHPYLSFLLGCLLSSIGLQAQENDRSFSLGVLGGISSYQGDLQPNSLSFKQSGKWFSLWLRKPVSPHIAIRSGISFGNIKAADALNRDYLKVRNLSFYSTVKEAFAELEFELMRFDRNRFSPYLQGGIAVFHFNPYTIDAGGAKVYLQPLSTEGQGLPGYPNRRPYKLYQPALTFGGGIRYAVSPNLIIKLQASQRKTFTDYLDDVSSSFVDESTLLAYKGPKAVELAYRGDELPNGLGYPKEGEQRGTPTEMDWFYFAGVAVEIKLDAVSELVGDFRRNQSDWYYKRCPKIDF